jgi:hypothetical protein
MGVAGESEGLPPNEPGNTQYLPDVLPASLEPIININYVDGLNLALTGEFLYLRSTVLPGCGCLAIANRLESLFKSASLIGGHYDWLASCLLCCHASPTSPKDLCLSLRE